MKLDRNNYYSADANREYWSASLVKEFLSCPARAVAELKGEYERPKTSALLIGSYVDACFSGGDEMEIFLAENPDIVNKRTGELKADFRKAQAMYERAASDELFMHYMEGDHQAILTGDVVGFPFKARFDVYVPGKRIVDLKTTKDMQPVWKAGEGRITFADAWNWPLQLAIYQAIEGNDLPCYLAVITKEDPPDISVIQIEQDKLDSELAFLAEKMPLFDAMKQGIIEPERCETCAYCRQTKKLKEVLTLEHYENLGGNNIE